MEDFITRPIGEKFDYEGTTLEVVECEEDDACVGCYFIDSMFCHKGEVLDIAGYCFSSVRKDKKDVVFKKVNESWKDKLVRFLTTMVRSSK